MMCDQFEPSPNSSNSSNLLPLVHHQLMLECSSTLSYRSNNLRAYLKEIVLGVSRFIQSDWTIITLCEGEMGQIAASSVDQTRDETGFTLHGTLAEEIMQSGRSLLIEDSRQHSQCHQLASEYRAYLGVPLKTSNGEVIGTICSFFREPCLLAESEVSTVELFAAKAATAIENYRLYQQQLQFNEQLTQRIATCSTDLQQSQAKLIEHERLAAIGEFTAMIVHEVRNPLTTIELGLKYAQKALSLNADRERLSLALSESHRLKRLLNEILSYAKPQNLQLRKLNIRHFFNALLVQIQDLPEAGDRPVHCIGDFPEIEIMADSDKLRQVFFNLFRNAFEAMQNSSCSRKNIPLEAISCSIKQDTASNWVCISIHNGGTPIPPELLPQLTTPFCSTKPSGTGLGLAISKRIVVAHGGELDIQSSSSGTTVSVHLPIISNECIPL